MEVFDTSHRFYVCVNISLQSLCDRYTGNMERFLFNKRSSCTRLRALCLAGLRPVPAGQGAAAAQAENTHVCERTRVPLESKPAFLSHPTLCEICFRAARRNSAVQLVTFHRKLSSWLRCTLWKHQDGV